MTDRQGKKPEKKHLLLSESGLRPDAGKAKKQDGCIDAEASPEDISMGESGFSEEALEQMDKGDTLGAIILRIDDMEGIADPDTAGDAIRETMEAICRKSGGYYRTAAAGEYVCLLPGANEKQCTDFVQAARKHIARAGNETISAGIAVYPTLSFEKEDIFENAKKALAHAAFFGADSMVCFDAVSLNISGDAFYQAGDIDGAMAEYELALEMDPDNVNVYNSMGVCHGERGDYDRALSSFAKAATLDPEDVFAIYNAGYIHMQRQEYEAALDYFRQALTIDDTIFELLFQTGRALYELGRPEEALYHIRSAISKSDAPGGIVYRYLGDCLLAVGDTGEAARTYNSAVKLRPDDAHCLSALAHCYESEGQNAEIALVFGQNAVEIEPDNGLFHHRLALMYLNRNRIEEALDHFEIALGCGYSAAGPYVESTRALLSQTDAKENAAGS